MKRISIRHPVAGLLLGSSIIASAIVAVQGTASAQSASRSTLVAPVNLPHIHGLAFSADGANLFIPDHHGLAVYGKGHWSTVPGLANDYMGFAVTKAAFYSSGHPAPNSNAVNPLGLMKSVDGGRTWSSLGLRGEADFHHMAASYGTSAIYVWNTGPNNRMPQVGLYRTDNDGFLWSHETASGLTGQIGVLAVHPSNPAIVAVVTNDGLFISMDSGSRFSARVNGVQVVSASFDLDGKHLWYGSYDKHAVLTRIALSGNSQDAKRIALPPLHNDAVAYIAQSPTNRSELAIATFQRSVFISTNDGQNWRMIARNGVTS